MKSLRLMQPGLANGLQGRGFFQASKARNPVEKWRRKKKENAIRRPGYARRQNLANCQLNRGIIVFFHIFPLAFVFLLFSFF